MCGGYVRGLRVNPDVVQYLPDIGAVGDEHNQTHLPTAVRAQQREHIVDAGYQHRPQVVRQWALGRHRLVRLGLGWEYVAQ